MMGCGRFRGVCPGEGPWRRQRGRGRLTLVGLAAVSVQRVGLVLADDAVGHDGLEEPAVAVGHLRRHGAGDTAPTPESQRGGTQQNSCLHAWQWKAHPRGRHSGGRTGARGSLARLKFGPHSSHTGVPRAQRPRTVALTAPTSGTSPPEASVLNSGGCSMK